MVHVENIKWPNTPIAKEYRRQKSKVAKKYCRHLKGVTEVERYYGDEGITILCCKKCGKALSQEELKQIDEALKKFNKK